MSKIRPSTQIALDGATTGQAMVVDPTGAFWTHGAPAPAAHIHAEADVTNLVTDLANLTVLHWMEP